MTRRRKVLIGFAAGAGLAAAVLWASSWRLIGWLMERQSAGAEIVVTHAGGNIYAIDARLRGRQIGGSMAASVGPDGVLLVDLPMTAALASKVRTALGELGAGPVVRAVLTHGHPDHGGGIAFVDPEVEVLAHTRARDLLARRARPFRLLPPVPTAVPEGRTLEVFDSAHTFRWNGEEVRVFHPGIGHTAGDAVVHFTGSGVAHVGDLFNGVGGHTASDERNAGGDTGGVVPALAAVLERLPADVRIIGGHAGVGQVASRSDLDRYLRLHTDVLAAVREQVDAGRDRDAVVAAGVPTAWRGWFEATRDDAVMHGPPDGWLGALYDALAASR